MIYKLLLFLLLFILIYLLLNKTKDNNKKLIQQDIQQFIPKKYNLYIYWEGPQPDYIKLCIDTIYKHCSKSYNIIKLDNTNIKSYLPELEINNKINNNLNKLLIPQRVDYYRILLLYKYGGLYLDCDILVLKDLKEITDKLVDYDFVGFGQTGNKIDLNKTGYNYPSNWCMASRPNGILMKKCLDNLNNKLNDDIINKSENANTSGYHNYGKMILWQELNRMKDYNYYHYSSKLDGTRDNNGYWVTTERLFTELNKNNKIEYLNEDDLLFIVLYNSEGDEYKKLTSNEILNNYEISRFYKKSLNLN